MNERIIKGFVQSISRLRKDHEFEDFRVIVGGDIFTCHSVILAGVSEFFAGLLRSNMKEQKEMEVRLVGMSSATFQIILDTIYTGCELLTKENVCDVWSAVHQLQIQFLLDYCEDFVKNNLSLETIETYKHRAEYVQSKNICDCVFNFMLTNFESLRSKKMFQELDFQYLTKLISNDKLVVKSEDSVLQVIFDWVSYGNMCTETTNIFQPYLALKANDLSLNGEDCTQSTKQMEDPSSKSLCVNLNYNPTFRGQTSDLPLVEESLQERRQLLISLLTSTRCYLASDSCIVRLYNSSLIKNDLLAKEFLFKALTFQLYDDWHGDWPTMAVYRDCSEVKHVGVTCRKGLMYAKPLKKEKMLTMSSLPIQQTAKLTVFRTKLYACSTGKDLNEIYVFQKGVWTDVIKVPHDVLMILAHDKYIYVFDSNEERFTRFDPDISPIKLETINHEIKNITHALSLHNNIVIFACDDENGSEKVVVYCWNTETQDLTQLDNLEFSSQNLTSFRDDLNTYILESNGNLWKLTNLDVIGFRLIGNTWTGNVKILGALLFRNTLFIYCYSQTPVVSLQLDKPFNQLISSTFLLRNDVHANLVHYVVHNNYLKPITP